MGTEKYKTACKVEFTPLSGDVRIEQMHSERPIAIISFGIKSVQLTLGLAQ